MRRRERFLGGSADHFTQITPYEVTTATPRSVKNSVRRILHTYIQYTLFYGFRKRTYVLLCV